MTGKVGHVPFAYHEAFLDLLGFSEGPERFVK